MQEILTKKNKKRLPHSFETASLDLKNRIAPLVTPTLEDENAKKFNLLILNIELSLLSPVKNGTKSINSVVELVRLLQDKTTIPQVNQKINVIREVLTENFWKNVTLCDLERIKAELRDLIKYLQDGDYATFTVDIEDEIADGGESMGILSIETYKQRLLITLPKTRIKP